MKKKEVRVWEQVCSIQVLLLFCFFRETPEQTRLPLNPFFDTAQIVVHCVMLAKNKKRERAPNARFEYDPLKI